jgi:hypothetical protein
MTYDEYNDDYNDEYSDELKPYCACVVHRVQQLSRFSLSLLVC